MKINSHSQLTDQQFVKAIRNCELPSSLFNHEAHIRLAWILVGSDTLDLAKKNIVEQISNYVKHLNEFNKFNLTLTIAGTEIIACLIKRSNTTNFSDFISEFPELISNFKQMIQSHYSLDIFSSEKAKTQYLKPDLIPFDYN